MDVMTNDKKYDESIDRLTQALVEDILSTPDEEILAESLEAGEDVKAVVQNTKQIFERAKSNLSKARLIEAKSAAKAYQQQSNKVLTMQPNDARKKLETLLAQHPETTAKLTLAARKGKELSDEDVKNMLEDLEELGIKSDNNAQE